MKIVAIILCLAGTALAQVSADEAARRLEERRAQRVAEPAPIAAPATRPSKSARLLHLEAIAFLRAGQPAKAAPLLEQAHRATPPEQLSRALILNRASVDVAQRANAMRAAKDICAYLQNHPGPDEDAANLLGSALQTAAKGNKLVLANNLFQSSEQRLKLAITELEQMRPQERKWGAQWMPASQFKEISNRLRDAETELRNAQSSAERARLKKVEAQEKWQSYNVIGIGRHIHNNRTHGDRAWCSECSRARSRQSAMDDAKVRLVTAEQEYKEALAAVDTAANAIPRPEWPLVYRALDPDDGPQKAYTAPPPPTTVPGEQTAASKDSPSAEIPTAASTEASTDVVPPPAERPTEPATQPAPQPNVNPLTGGLFSETNLK